MVAGVSAWLEAVRGVTAPNVFNPYNSECPQSDKSGAADVRFALLTQMLERAVDTGVESIWIGRDLGYRGGRRTGLALTDDVHLHAHLDRWGLRLPEPFLKGDAVAERTASIIWNHLRCIEESVFLWNVFPFHPYLNSKPMSNRAHSLQERAVGEDLLAGLVRLLNPKKIIAVGKDAHRSAVRCAEGVDVRAVRHPSYGGQAEFARGVHSLYALDSM